MHSKDALLIGDIVLLLATLCAGIALRIAMVFQTESRRDALRAWFAPYGDFEGLTNLGQRLRDWLVGLSLAAFVLFGALWLIPLLP